MYSRLVPIGMESKYWIERTARVVALNLCVWTISQCVKPSFNALTASAINVLVILIVIIPIMGQNDYKEYFLKHP